MQKYMSLKYAEATQAGGCAQLAGSGSGSAFGFPVRVQVRISVSGLGPIWVSDFRYGFGSDFGFRMKQPKANARELGDAIPPSEDKSYTASEQRG